MRYRRTCTRALLSIAALAALACGVPPETVVPDDDVGDDALATGPAVAAPDTWPPVAAARDEAPAGEAAVDLPIREFRPNEQGAPASAAPTEVRRVDGEVDGVHDLVDGFATLTGWVEVSGLASAGFVSVEIVADGTTVTERRFLVRSSSEEAQRNGIRRNFGVDVPLPSGDHELCVSAQSAGGPRADLGCHRCRVGAPAEETNVVLTAVVPASDRSVEVRGVVTGTDAAPDMIVLQVSSDDGAAFVELAAPVAGRAFAVLVPPRHPGRHRICPAPPEEDAVTGCGTVAIGDVCVGTTGTTAGPVNVEAPDEHPMTRAERDAGVSVRLRDGSTMWFFGDTGEREPGGLRYFVNNTAAWATADAPAVTLDAAGPAEEPALFAAPTENFCAGHRFGKPVLWPDSAVAIPQPDGTDRVLVVLSKVCTAPGAFSYEGVGLAVAEYRYDPADPPTHRPIEGTIVEPDFAGPERTIGSAMLRVPGGHVFGYQCGELRDEQRECIAGRVAEEQLADPAAWEFWTGGPVGDPASWSSRSAAALPMEMPGAEERPIAAFTVVYDEFRGVYLMAYSPWPVFTDRVVVRVATSPVGPWTHALPIELPGCVDERSGERLNCYAGTAQPSFDTSFGVGVGFYDQLEVTGSNLGEYRACTVPLAVTLPVH